MALAQVISSRSVVGLAERYAALDVRARGDAAPVLRGHAHTEELPLPGGRGVSDAFDWIARHLADRELVDDLGTHRTQFDWFMLHAPPGGTASLRWRKQVEEKLGVSLKLVGSGFGSGRSVDITTTTEHVERHACLRLAHEVEVHVRRYAVPTARGFRSLETTVDVLGVGAMMAVASDPCPLCRKRSAEIDPFEYEVAGLAIDLIHDDAAVRQTVAYDLTGEDELTVGLAIDVAGAGAVNAGFTARRRFHLSCEIAYLFPPGRRFTPYKAIGAAMTLPFWSVTTAAGS